MFVGHFGAGLAAKKVTHKVSLGTLFFAAQFIDLLWPLLLLIGIEKVAVHQSDSPFTNMNFIYYPFSHSLVGVIFWAVLFGGVYYLIKKNIRASVILALLVISHWLLDLLTHVPDLPVSPGISTKVGLGLWNSVPATLIIELLIFAAGIYLYLKNSPVMNTAVKLKFWGLIIFLLISYFMSLAGPPPDDQKLIAYVGFSQWILIAWGYWIDRHQLDDSSLPLQT